LGVYGLLELQIGWKGLLGEDAGCDKILAGAKVGNFLIRSNLVESRRLGLWILIYG